MNHKFTIPRRFKFPAHEEEYIRTHDSIQLIYNIRLQKKYNNIKRKCKEKLDEPLISTCSYTMIHNSHENGKKFYQHIKSLRYT